MPTAKLLTRNIENSNLPPEEKWLKDVQEMIRTDRKLTKKRSQPMKRQNLEPFTACMKLAASKVENHSYGLEKLKDLETEHKLGVPSLKPCRYEHYHQQQKKEIIRLMRKH